MAVADANAKPRRLRVGSSSAAPGLAGSGLVREALEDEAQRHVAAVARAVHDAGVPVCAPQSRSAAVGCAGVQRQERRERT